MGLTNQFKNQHLLWRAGFGPSTNDLQSLELETPVKLYERLLIPVKQKPARFNLSDNLLSAYLKDARKENKNNAGEEAAKLKQREFAKESRELIKDLNLTWINEMTNSDAQLTEKMALFWHGHFACRNQNIYFQEQLLNRIRDNALGNFGDLLKAVSKSAAMLAFLNNQQNRKSHPNENFAREVMELFTLGRGNYTEHDVKEGARAFTGWGFNAQGEFVFRKFVHDDGEKTFLGKKGNFDGDDVLNILLEQKSTAFFITRKVYGFFVNEVPDEKQVSWLANRFHQSNYDIAALMKDIFTSDWFYEEKNIGNHIKSPVELLVGIRRVLPVKLENEEVQLLMQRALGQILFYPPNVAGWPGGKNWIDSSALMLRMRLPQLIAGNDVFAITPKTDDDQQMGMMEQATVLKKKKVMAAMGAANRFKIKADINWADFVKRFDSVPKAGLYDALEKMILQTKSGSVASELIEKVADKSSREGYIKSVTVALMSTPEYQLG